MDELFQSEVGVCQQCRTLILKCGELVATLRSFHHSKVSGKRMLKSAEKENVCDVETTTKQRPMKANSLFSPSPRQTPPSQDRPPLSPLFPQPSCSTSPLSSPMSTPAPPTPAEPISLSQLVSSIGFEPLIAQIMKDKKIVARLQSIMCDDVQEAYTRLAGLKWSSLLREKRKIRHLMDPTFLSSVYTELKEK